MLLEGAVNLRAHNSHRFWEFSVNVVRSFYRELMLVQTWRKTSEFLERNTQKQKKQKSQKEIVHNLNKSSLTLQTIEIKFRV